MKKILLFILLLTPAAVFSQLSVSGIGGENGYMSMRAEFMYRASPYFYIVPKYSFFQNNDTVDPVSRYGLRLGVLPHDRVDLAIEGSFTPEVNGYSSYSAGADGKIYLLQDERGPVSSFYVGAGADYINHKQTPGFFSDGGYALRDFNIDLMRGRAFAGGRVGPLSFTAEAVKTLSVSDEPEPGDIIWEDIPFFISVDNAVIDIVYFAGVSAPLGPLTLSAGYSSYKYKVSESYYQSLRGGASLNIQGLVISGSVEVRELGKEDSTTFYSFSGGLNF